jgi:RNA polymerase sigma factor (sigma-70 family)
VKTQPRKYPPLTREQQALAAQFMGLAIKYARKWFLGAGPHVLEEAIAEANVGLCLAASNYDADKSSFSTYAHFWVEAVLLKFMIRYRGGDLKIGTTREERIVFFNIGRARRYLEMCGREVTNEALARRLKVAPDIVDSVTRRMQGQVQYQHLGELTDRPFDIPDHGDSPETVIARGDEMEKRGRALRRAMLELDSRQRQIIRWRWLGAEIQTLDVISKRIGVSRERVRQIEAISIAFLRDRLIAAEEIKMKPTKAAPMTRAQRKAAKKVAPKPTPPAEHDDDPARSGRAPSSGRFVNPPRHPGCVLW